MKEMLQSVGYEEKPSNEVETVRGPTHLGDREGTGVRCEASVAARTSCWRDMFGTAASYCRQSVSSEAERSVYKSYERSLIPYGSKAWCPKE